MWLIKFVHVVPLHYEDHRTKDTNRIANSRTSLHWEDTPISEIATDQIRGKSSKFDPNTASNLKRILRMEGRMSAFGREVPLPWRHLSNKFVACILLDVISRHLTYM